MSADIGPSMHHAGATPLPVSSDATSLPSRVNKRSGRTRRRVAEYSERRQISQQQLQAAA
ncbi:MAG TPA: hypothetical protein VGE02_02430 [Gemmatimonadales bacterium]